MPANDDRRRAIDDAAVAVVARLGLRGLTHRAVDAEAGLPTGTTSNYHRTRRSLLDATGARCLERLRARGTDLAGAHGLDALVRSVLAYVDASVDDTEALLAWFELRLLAARDPSLDHATTALAGRHEANVAHGAAHELPGSADEHRRVLHALDGVLLAAATGSTTRAEALRDAEALVRSLVTSPRRWFRLR